ncbi:hypothetical protein CI102_10690 [Trichoderma harzianum]|nr:hypothetical protein CI102_10690 [Trichoderma harzianum]
MIGILLLVLAGVARVISQVTHNTGEFSYQGCSSIDPACFGEPIGLPNGPLTPETCQLACRGHQFAALLPDCCRCGDDPNGVHPTDEAKCDYPCMGDSTRGMCGSICPENSPVVANVYTRVTPTQGPIYGEPTSVQSSVAAAETSCSSADASSVGEPQQSSQRPLTPPGNAPEPKTYSDPKQQVPNATPASNPPGYSSDCQPSRPDSYSDGHGAGETPEGYTSAGNCQPAGSPALSPVVSESTLWPFPSKKPEGSPPAPSHVPASDSPCGVIPPLSSIGGFVLLAAMIM